jgi:hypothetical protein
MEIDPAYEGREHSLIKHELLKGYAYCKQSGTDHDLL